MPEQYSNLASTTVGSGGYTAASGSLQVISTAGAFPTSGTFRLAIADQTTLNVKVILQVTAITDSTHFAVTAEGTDANANAGDLVYAVVSAGALNQIRSDMSQIGTFASLPSTTGQTAGNRYRCIDAPYEAIFDGTKWRYFMPGLRGGEVFPPSAASGSWSWDHQNSATLDSTRGMFDFQLVHTATTTGTAYYKTKTAPFTITACIDPFYATLTPMTGSGNNMGWGLCFRSATGQLVVTYGYPSGPGLALEKWSSTTSFSASYQDEATAAAMVYGGPFWIRIYDDNTNVHFYWSQNGQRWMTYYSVSRTDFLTGGPVAAGLFFYTNSGDFNCNIISWQES